MIEAIIICIVVLNQCKVFEFIEPMDRIEVELDCARTVEDMFTVSGYVVTCEEYTLEGRDERT